MKQVSEEFKQKIISYGREQDAIITFGNTTITSDDLNGIFLYYEGRLLKSVMKGLNLDCNIEIPVGTEFVLKYGLKVNEEYEYINLGTFIVRNTEYQEDTYSYSIECYDRLLYSMVEYQEFNKVYPISIRDYITKLCEQIGLEFKNKEDIFPNYNKMIYTELYLNLNYTFRDVLDELAQVTAGIICIDEQTGQVEIRNIKETNEEIDENYFNEVNVNFGEKFGPINSIVLSRVNADNVYARDEQSILENGLTELKIIDNQIMNFNDRSNYLSDMLTALNGIEYYLNDFSSSGIMYFDLLDRYTVRIGENTYSCVMFNNEINIEQGLEELIYTNRPEESKTDYEKADKTDRKINQTYLIVDKQNQKIESVVNLTTEQNEKINRVTQTVDELNSKISDIADTTISSEKNTAKVELENINKSEPIRVVVRPIVDHIAYLYPSPALYPSADLYPRARKLRFENTKTNEYFDYEIPDDLFYHDSENYDEFILDYDSQTCVINKRVGFNNEDRTTYILEKPETIEYDEYPKIPLTDGDYVVSIYGYNVGYLFVRLMVQNIYTTQFATRAELSSEINQTTKEINLSVDQKLELYPTTEEMTGAINISAGKITQQVQQKVGNDEIIAKINLAVQNKQGIINITGNQVTIDSDYFTLDKNGKIVAISGTIAGWNIETNKLYKDLAGISTNTNQVFYAGEGLGIDGKPKFYVSNNGLVKAEYFLMNVEGGIFEAVYNSGRTSLEFGRAGLYWRLDNENNNLWCSLFRDAQYQRLGIFDAYGFIIEDLIHGEVLANFKRIDNAGNPAEIQFWANTYINGYLVDPTISDERIKNNILDSEIKALELINKIHHKSFDWDKEKAHKEGHIDCGYIAQELIKIDPNFVIYNKEHDTYQINTLYVLATSTKAIQELNAKIEKRDKIIEFLAEKLGCKNEVLEMLKEGE